MTDRNPQAQADLDAKVDDLETDVERLDRPDRAIPLPEDDEDDDGVGQVTGLIP